MSEYLPMPILDSGDPGQGQYKWFNALLHGGRCLGYEKLTVDDAPAVALTPSAGAKYAILFVEADATNANLNRAIHWREDGTNPTTGAAGEGMVLGDNGVLDIKGAANIADFRMIGREAGKVHTVRVQYYGQG
jgi:hypothetical protein